MKKLMSLLVAFLTVSYPVYDVFFVANADMQVDFNSDGTYDHLCILIDAINQKFAQHFYNGYRYLLDYVGTKRLYRPRFFRAY